MMRCTHKPNVGYYHFNYKKYAKYKIKALSGCLDIIKEKNTVNCIYDLMAGVGISGNLFANYFPESKLLLNDQDEKCVEILKQNIFLNNPNIHIIQARYQYVHPTEKVDLVFLDFNSFTVNEYHKHARIQLKDLQEWLNKNKRNLKYVMISDGFLFCTKFLNLEESTEKIRIYDKKFVSKLPLEIIFKSPYDNKECCVYLCKIKI